MQAVVQGDASQNIHLTDIFTTQFLTALQIHLGDPQGDGSSPVTSREFFALEADIENQIPEINSYRKWIAVQVGADYEIDKN